MPLRAWVYLVRNAGKTIPLIAVIVLATMLVTSIVALINSIPFSIRTTYAYTQEFIAIGPRGDPTMGPYILKKIRTKAPVPIERLIVCRGVGTIVKSIVGKWPFTVIALDQKDFGYLLHRENADNIEGRLPKAGAAEAIVSDPVARNLKLKIGSSLLGPKNDDGYSPKDVKVVGIAHTDRWMMLTDIEYVRANHFPPIDSYLVFARTAAEQRKLDDWGDKAFKGERTVIFTYEQLEKDTSQMFRILYKILNVVIAILVVVITIMMGMLINIYQGQRLVEFGLLQALGYTKKYLIKRVLAETIIVVVVGWILGLLTGVLVLKIAKAGLMDPNAFALDVFDKAAYIQTLPIPTAILVVAIFTVVSRFRKFDPVGVVERRLV